MSDTQRDREERQHVIEVLKSWDGYFIGYTSDEVQEALRYAISSIETDLRYDLLYEETSGQADKQADKPTTKNNLGVDAISRKAVQTRLKEIINEMETIFADIREREVNDSVCGLCEYDCDHGLDGFANECPGFEKNDCFKLNEKYKAEWLDISNLPSVTPIRPKGHWIETAEEYYKAINEKGGGVNENTEYFTDDIACSECLAKFSVIDNEADRFDFCPCCGSDNR